MKFFHWLPAVVALAATACGDKAPPPYGQPAGGGPAYGYGYQANFRDDAQTNTAVEPGKLDLVLKDSAGKAVDLKQYRGKKNLVVVITRGFSGYVCPNCSAQTSRLVANYPEFVKRDAEVLVVFPGPAKHLQDFVQAVRSQAGDAPVPFPLLLDEGYKAVDQLGIRAQGLPGPFPDAKPATYILDKQGKVVFAYVGTNTADRPSLKAVLGQLDRLGKG
jgi:peroxiredoxin